MEITTAQLVETRVTSSHFGNNYTDVIMVHAITKGVLVAPRQIDTKTQQNSINNSTAAVEIFTTVKIKTMPGGME